MALEGAAQTDTDLAAEAAQLSADTKSLRNQARTLSQRAAALRDKLAEAGIGFADDNPTARESEGDPK